MFPRNGSLGVSLPWSGVGGKHGLGVGLQLCCAVAVQQISERGPFSRLPQPSCTELSWWRVCLLGRGVWTGGEALARRPQASCRTPLSSVSSLLDGNDVFRPAFPTMVLSRERVKEAVSGNAFHNSKGQADAKDCP